MIVVHALELNVVEKAGLPVDVRRETVLGIEELRLRTKRPNGAWHQTDQSLEIPVERERHIFHLNGLELSSGVGAVSLENSGGGNHIDCLGDDAGLQLEVDSRRIVHEHDDVVAHRLPEAGLLNFNAVSARLEIREHIGAAGVGRRAAADASVNLGDLDLRLWN